MYTGFVLNLRWISGKKDLETTAHRQYSRRTISSFLGYTEIWTTLSESGQNVESRAIALTPFKRLRCIVGMYREVKKAGGTWPRPHEHVWQLVLREREGFAYEHKVRGSDY